MLQFRNVGRHEIRFEHQINVSNISNLSLNLEPRPATPRATPRAPSQWQQYYWI